MASLFYDIDNFSGKYTHTNDVVEITGNVYSLEVDDFEKTIYLFGETDIDTCMLDQKNAQRWSNGSYVDFYKDEKQYKKSLQRYLNQGYTIINN